VCSESSQLRLEQRVHAQTSVNDEVTSLLRYENRLQREIVKELGYVSSCQLFIVSNLSREHCCAVFLNPKRSPIAMMRVVAVVAISLILLPLFKKSLRLC